MNKPLLRKLSLTAILSVFGIAGNALPLPISFGVMFIFGSIFSVIAVSRLGTGAGAAVALIASGYTYFIWYHPWAIVIFTAEIIWMGIALKRGKSNLLLIDGLYWLVLGAPLVVFFYGGVMGQDAQHTFIIVLKQGLNGVLNTLVAWISLSLLTPFSGQSNAHGRRRKSPYDQTIFQMAAFFLMIPALGILLVLNHREVSATQARILDEMQAESRFAAQSIETWVSTYMNATGIIAELGTNSRLLPSDALQEEMERIHKLFPLFYTVFLADDRATNIACSPAVNEKGQSTIGINLGDRFWFKELRGTLRPVISDVFVGQATIFSPIFVMATPVVKDGKLSHFGLGTVNLVELQKLLNQLSHYQKTACTIIDQHGKVIVSTDRARKPLETLKQTDDGQTIPMTPQVSLRLPGKKRSVNVMENWKGAYYFSKLPIRGTSWTFLVEFSVAPMQSYFFKSAIQGLSIVAIFFVVMILLAALISRYLTTPILSLARISRNLPTRVADHESIAWPQSNFLELSDLIENFQQSAQTIEANMATINSHNEQLEKTVAARTAELEALTGNLREQVENEVALRLKGEQIMLQQSKLAAMGEMLGAIAHQWRQPLNALGLIIQNLQDGYKFGEMTPDKLEHSVRQAMEQIQYMSKTIDDLRNFFKPDKEKTPFDAMQAVSEAIQLVSAQLAAHRIGWRLTCHTHNRSYGPGMKTTPSCTAMVISGYRNEFRHVVLNIIRNAQDAILTKEAPGQIDLDFYHDDAAIVIRIADNGGGIDTQIIYRIFEPYFTTKGPDKGTGMGLYMSSLIIEQMGGRLRAENSDRGAVFVVELPGAND